MKRFLGFAVALVGFIGSATAILCYDCNSATNILCSESVLPDNLRRNCSDLDRGVTHTLCRKIVQHVDHEVNGHMPESRVIRTCGWDDSKFKSSCYQRSGFGGRQEICTCTTDYCNSSPSMSSLKTLLLAHLLMTKLLY